MSQLEPRPAGGTPRKFHLDRDNSIAAGVCSGLARYLGVDPLVVRLVFAIGTIVGFGSFILIYIAIALLAD